MDEAKAFHMTLASLAFQALYGALLIGSLIFAAVMAGNDTAFALGMVAGLMVLLSNVVVGRSIASLNPNGFRAAQVLWYAAFAFGCVSFALLA